MLRVGCVVDRVPEPDEANPPRFLELRLRTPLPRVGTLRRARAEAAADAPASAGAVNTVLALRAPAECVVSSAGPLVSTPELERSLTWLHHAAEALGASLIVLTTPLEVTPGARSRDLLRAYADRLPRPPGRVWVWSPRGPWDPETLYEVGASLDWVCAFDPLHAPRPPGPVGYGQLLGLGVETRLSTPALERALAAMEPERGSAYLAVEGPHAGRHASLLQAMADARE